MTVSVALDNLRLDGPARTLAGIDAAWRVGQLIAARAETPSDSLGRLVIRIGGEAVTAVSPVAVQAGAPLTLLVQSLGPPPLLQLVTAHAADEAVIARHLRQTLPQDGAIKPLLDVVLRSRHSDRIPGPVRALLDALVRHLPEVAELRGAGRVRRALGDSGVFLEARLGERPAPDLRRDFKAQLLRLNEAVREHLARYALPRPAAAPGQGAAARPGLGAAVPLREIIRLFASGGVSAAQLARAALDSLPQDQRIALDEALQDAAHSRPQHTAHAAPVRDLLTALLARPAPRAEAAELLALLRALPLLEELRQTVDQALSRLLTTQILTLAEDPDAVRLLLVDLALRDREELDTVHMRFEAPARERGARDMRVTLHFEDPELGAIEVRLVLNEDRLTTTFTAEHAGTADGIERHLPLLHRALVATGLQVDGVRVACAGIAREPLTPAGIPLLDERA